MKKTILEKVADNKFNAVKQLVIIELEKALEEYEE